MLFEPVRSSRSADMFGQIGLITSSACWLACRVAILARPSEVRFFSALIVADSLRAPRGRRRG